jgi:hypothetical protein
VLRALVCFLEQIGGPCFPLDKERSARSSALRPECASPDSVPVSVFRAPVSFPAWAPPVGFSLPRESHGPSRFRLGPWLCGRRRPCFCADFVARHDFCSRFSFSVRSPRRAAKILVLPLGFAICSCRWFGSLLLFVIRWKSSMKSFFLFLLLLEEPVGFNFEPLV